MNGLMIKLPSAVTDQSLPRLGEFRLGLYKKGTGSTRNALKFSLSEASEITINGGDFYSAASGGTPLAKTISTVLGNNTIYVQVTSDEGFISFKESTKITGLGFTGSSNQLFQGVGLAVAAENINGGAVSVNVDALPVNTTIFEISPDTIISGDINSFKRATDIGSILIQQNSYSAARSTFGGTLTSDIRVGTRTGQFLVMLNKDTTIPIQYLKGSTIIDVRPPIGSTSTGGLVKVIGSLSSIPSTVTNFNIATGIILESTSNLSELTSKTALTRINIAGNTTLTGSLHSMPANVTDVQIYTNTNITYSGTKTWAPLMRAVSLPSSTLATAQLDQILIDLAATTWDVSRPLVLKGTRSSASDDAIANLTGKGVNITIIP